MQSQVQKWGNSLSLRIPKPKRKRKYTLEELLAQVTPENIHPEIDFGPPVGKEVW